MKQCPMRGGLRKGGEVKRQQMSLAAVYQANSAAL